MSVQFKKNIRVRFKKNIRDEVERIVFQYGKSQYVRLMKPVEVDQYGRYDYDYACKFEYYTYPSGLILANSFEVEPSKDNSFEFMVTYPYPSTVVHKEHIEEVFDSKCSIWSDPPEDWLRWTGTAGSAGSAGMAVPDGNTGNTVKIDKTKIKNNIWDKELDNIFDE